MVICMVDFVSMCNFTCIMVKLFSEPNDHNLLYYDNTPSITHIYKSVGDLAR